MRRTKEQVSTVKSESTFRHHFAKSTAEKKDPIPTSNPISKSEITSSSSNKFNKSSQNQIDNKP